ncbi:MAG: hypothetical protein LC117_07870 [Bacteroidia bacterium]|nr:hypothetical protein [Bacteroidia bacterium]MCZ2277828.1 hypothetical protein [Bacteroidia bacterium]
MGKTSLIISFLVLSVYSISLAQQIVTEWNFPNNPDDATVDVSNPLNTTAVLITQGGTGALGFTQAGATTRSANCTNWASGSGLKWWEITINTIGCNNLEISSKQYSSATGPRDFRIDYRIGAGAWTALVNVTVATNWTSGVVLSNALPITCENQPAVSFRWIMTSNIAVNGSAVAAGGNTRIDDISVSWNSSDYYRSINSGNWNNTLVWESSPDNITWNPAIMPPSKAAKTITIRNPDIITINSNVNLDETYVEPGATLSWQAFNLTVSNGPGVDLHIDGTFWDNASNNVTFNAGAAWQLGANATIIKTNNGSANNWRDYYNGGIALIPATANWIIRKISGNNPSVSSLAMYYPNLTIENNTAGNWIATGPSSFQGASGTIVVKGFLDIGGSGSSTVEFECTNTNAFAVTITGNLLIRPGNKLRNYGTGFELYSDLICQGDIIHDANDPRRLIFSGNNPQVISGSGQLNIWNLIMNKTADDLTLNRSVVVKNNLQFNNPGGRIITSALNLLTIEALATVTNANNNSFVHGPVRKLGNPAFVFPTGKNNVYRPIAINAGSGGGGGVFWTEEFGTGCNTGQLVTAYSGPNGSWTMSTIGANDPGANTWFVSAAENGQGAGVCGAACGSNRTLHVGATYPTTDPGAAYYESTPGFCPGWFPCSFTDKRAESPVIDCTGKSAITISFNYIEFGQGTSDNATLWFNDGLVWSQLIDLPKTLCCGSVPCNGSLQALWTAYSIALPASADNNPNVRIGFRWTNNADGTGTDPSFAVDDIQLSTTAITESFTAEYFYSNPQIVFNNILNAPLDHISQCEYWELSRDAGSSNRVVTLSWDNNSCGVTNLADLRVARFNGLSWDDRGNGGTTGNNAAGTIASLTAQTAYGPFTLSSVTSENPLPVELLSFTGELKNKVVELKWVTLSEKNCDYFRIQRSANGKWFEEIGYLKGSGNTSTITNYYFQDEQPLEQLSFYRLRQVDFNGSDNFSKTITISASAVSAQWSIISVFSEPNSNLVSVQLHAEEGIYSRLAIIDAIGKTIIDLPVEPGSGIQNLKIEASGWAKGIYSVVIYNKAGISRTRFAY